MPSKIHHGITPVCLAICAALVTIGPAAATEETEPSKIEVLTVWGSAHDPSKIPGSISFISPEDLDTQVNSDVLRILRAVPGVNLQEEDGFGLRPNIGIRGTGSDRSSRVLILEDSVPIAPAPYAAPAAYYFPSAGRIHSIEVTKGPGVIKYGPFTTGGAINLFSTPIPDENAASLDAFVGEFGHTRLHGWAGSRFEVSDGLAMGLLLETYQDQSDGFKELDGGGGTGFDVVDYVLKVGFYTPETAKIPQRLELKYQHREETSNETYLGLTQEDFSGNPFRRYAASARDQMRNTHNTYQVTHVADLTGDLSLTTLGYYTTFARNWYKLQGINVAGSGGIGDTSISSILDDPATFSDEYKILQGASGFVSADDAIVLRANNRDYSAWGIQSALTFDAVAGPLTHGLTLGVRYHEDDVDRFQHENAYRMDNGSLVLTNTGAPGSQSNRVEEAEAFAVFLEDQMYAGPWNITAGLRYESIETRRFDFSTADPTRVLGPTSTRENSYDVLLYSLGVTYDVSEELSLIAGLHKGFSPSSPGNVDTDPERSLNFEAGGRYASGPFSAEVIGYFNGYENLLGDCTNSTGGNCTIGDQFDAGQVDVYGIEAVLEMDAAHYLDTELELPLQLIYSYAASEFQDRLGN
jgi:Fe(3+) dicitrate transport protein